MVVLAGMSGDKNPRGAPALGRGCERWRRPFDIYLGYRPTKQLAVDHLVGRGGVSGSSYRARRPPHENGGISRQRLPLADNCCK